MRLRQAAWETDRHEWLQRVGNDDEARAQRAFHFRALRGQARIRGRVMHEFDFSVALVPGREGWFAGKTSPAYGNMVGPFGGITNAVMLNSVMTHPGRMGDPIALTTNFASPIADGDFEVGAVPVRTNRSTQHWSMELVQDGTAAATGTAVFAQRRETWSSSEAAAPLELPTPHSLPQVSTAGLPAWVSRYDMRYVQGGLPEAFDGREHDDSYSVCWLRDSPARPLDFLSLAALCDGFFPRILIRRRQMMPVGTISLTTYFHADADLLAAQGDRHVIGVARASNFRHGYFEQNAEIWSDAGYLLATSHQMVYFRE